MNEQNQIVCFSLNDNAKIFQSIGISVSVYDTIDELKFNLKLYLNKNFKIIIIDEEVNDLIYDIKEKYENEVYPIFLSLPLNAELTGKSLNEMKNMIEKTIGVSGF